MRGTRTDPRQAGPASRPRITPAWKMLGGSGISRPPGTLGALAVVEVCDRCGARSFWQWALRRLRGFLVRRATQLIRVIAWVFSSSLEETANGSRNREVVQPGQGVRFHRPR